MAACNNYYEPFKGFHEKIKNACECIGENGHEAVATEVETIKSSISSLDVSGYWDDSVGQDFITVKESFVGSLETVLSSINGTWSTSEGLYQNLDQELQNLSDTQNAYIEFWGTKPQENEYKETVIAVDKSGNETSHTITMPEYWRKLAEWNNQNADYLTKFQGIIDSIKSLAEQLASLGSERVSVGDLGTIGGLSSIVAQFSSSFSTSIYDNIEDNENYRVIEVPEGLGTEYTYMGWQKVTGNNTSQLALRISSGQQFDERGFGMIDGRYVVAMTSTFGAIGDYVDIYLGNGDIIKAVLGDEKSQEKVAWDPNPANKWGHCNGKRVVEFVVDCNKWYNSTWSAGKNANPGTGMYNEEFANNGGVTKVINTGINYFELNNIDRTAYTKKDITDEFVKKY